VAEDQPSRDDDSLHPVRRLRRESLGRTHPSQAAPVPPPADPPPAASPDSATPSHHRTRLRLAIGLALALAVSGVWSAVALHGLPPAPPTTVNGSPVPAATAVPAQAAADAIGDLHMFSQTTGWAQRLGDAAILHTTHGVLRWTVASPPTSEVVIAVAYLGSETARALTVPADAVGPTTVQSWATADGGVTWSAGGSFAVVGYNPSVSGSLDFVDTLHGWFSEIELGPAIGGTALYRTVNGGMSWTEVAAFSAAGPTGTGGNPTSCVDLEATFISVATGWLTGSCTPGPPPLFITHDGGLTWTDQPLRPRPGSLYGETSYPPAFTSAENGTLLTENAGGATPVSTALFATTDAGQSWSLRYSSDGTPFGTDFVDADHGWLVMLSADGDAADPDLYATGDGGTTWSIQNAFPFGGMDLDFLTTTTGWASTDLSQYSGGASYLLSTDNGGQSWIALTPRLMPAG
jgi:photosystem II stability/assembly factor-like uncharacterized protein